MDQTVDAPEYRELLKRARRARCTCQRESKTLAKAAELGCVKCCMKLIHQSSLRAYANTALMQAALHGHIDVAKLLLPCEVGMQNNFGQTALMIAAHTGRLEIVQLLAPHEAKLQCSCGWTALMKAARGGHLEIARLLAPQEATMRDKAGWTALMVSAQEGHAEIVELLIPQEAKVQDKRDETALMMSAEKGHLEALRLLLPFEAGLKGKNNETAALLAAQSCRFECLSSLLESAPEVEASGITPAMLAAYRGDARALAVLKGELQAKSVGWTALDFALLGGQRSAVRLLTGARELRAFFARETMQRATRGWAESFGFFSRCGPLLLSLLSLICAADSACRSALFLCSVAKPSPLLRRLRPFCTPDSASIMRFLEQQDDVFEPASALGSVKHLGFSLDARTAASFAKGPANSDFARILSAPLRQQHLKQAAAEAKKRIPNVRQIAWREVEAESAFNRNVLLEARDAGVGSRPAPRHGAARGAARTRQKREVCKVLLLDAFRFMERVVREMLAE